MIVYSLLKASYRFVLFFLLFISLNIPLVQAGKKDRLRKDKERATRFVIQRLEEEVARQSSTSVTDSETSLLGDQAVPGSDPGRIAVKGTAEVPGGRLHFTAVYKRPAGSQSTTEEGQAQEARRLEEATKVETALLMAVFLQGSHHTSKEDRRRAQEAKLLVGKNPDEAVVLPLLSSNLQQMRGRLKPGYRLLTLETDSALRAEVLRSIPGHMSGGIPEEIPVKKPTLLAHLNAVTDETKERMRLLASHVGWKLGERYSTDDCFQELPCDTEGALCMLAPFNKIFRNSPTRKLLDPQASSLGDLAEALIQAQRFAGVLGVLVTYVNSLEAGQLEHPVVVNEGCTEEYAKHQYPVFPIHVVFSFQELFLVKVREFYRVLGFGGEGRSFYSLHAASPPIMQKWEAWKVAVDTQEGMRPTPLPPEVSAEFLSEARYYRFLAAMLQDVISWKAEENRNARDEDEWDAFTDDEKESERQYEDFESMYDEGPPLVMAETSRTSTASTSTSTSALTLGSPPQPVGASPVVACVTASPKAQDVSEKERAEKIQQEERLREEKAQALLKELDKMLQKEEKKKERSQKAQEEERRKKQEAARLRRLKEVEEAALQRKEKKRSQENVEKRREKERAAAQDEERRYQTALEAFQRAEAARQQKQMAALLKDAEARVAEERRREEEAAAAQAEAERQRQEAEAAAAQVEAERQRQEAEAAARANKKAKKKQNRRVKQAQKAEKEAAEVELLRQEMAELKAKQLAAEAEIQQLKAKQEQTEEKRKRSEMVKDLHQKVELFNQHLRRHAMIRRVEGELAQAKGSTTPQISFSQDCLIPITLMLQREERTFWTLGAQYLLIPQSHSWVEEGQRHVSVQALLERGVLQRKSHPGLVDLTHAYYIVPHVKMQSGMKNVAEKYALVPGEDKNEDLATTVFAACVFVPESEVITTQAGKPLEVIFSCEGSSS